jgi:hypothetical protein
VDKYARVAHPEFSGLSGRTRIKQRFVAGGRPVPQQWYPPKWKLKPPEPPVNAGRRRMTQPLLFADPP